MRWDVNKAVNHLINHAEPHSISKCGTYTRQAIEAGGLKLIRTGSAKNYGPSLVKAGFTEYSSIPPGGYVAGDVAVIQPAKNGSPDGHMQMYSGNRWISDFVQRDFWPGAKYRASTPSFKIYRMLAADNISTPVSEIGSAPIHPLRQGNRGHNVLLVQQKLISLGYRIADDSIFGPITKEAVMRFQTSMFLTRDGIVGPKTWKALFG